MNLFKIDTLVINGNPLVVAVLVIIILIFVATGVSLYLQL